MSTTTDATTAPTSEPGDGAVLTAAEGAAARSRLPSRGDENKLAASADQSFDGGCGVYTPTAEEIEQANADTEAYAAELERFGITVERSVDELGFTSVDYDSNDVVAQSVSDSYWAALYPVEPPSQEQLDEIIAQNDVIAATFDAAGVAYTRTTDDVGYEAIEYDMDDPAAQAAMNDAWNTISPPQPPDAETLARQSTENSALAAALEEAGITYEVRSDELGWEWIEWNPDDAAANDVVSGVWDELYPPVAIDPIDECFLALDAVTSDAVTSDAATSDAVSSDAVSSEVAPIDDTLVSIDDPLVSIDEMSPEVVAVRDAEVAALVDGFTAAGVTNEVRGESPWQSVIFDVANPAAVDVVAAILAGR